LDLSGKSLRKIQNREGKFSEPLKSLMDKRKNRREASGVKKENGKEDQGPAKTES